MEGLEIADLYYGLQGTYGDGICTQMRQAIMNPEPVNWFTNGLQRQWIVKSTINTLVIQIINGSYKELAGW